MANIVTSLLGYFGLGRGGVLSEQLGEQYNRPNNVLVSDVQDIKVDGALQLAAVWSCLERRANTIASLPLFVYRRNGDGQKEMARDSRLYSLLHDSPNARMTPYDFWRVMLLNHDLRGNAYARIDRDENGEAVALWPMSADQVEVNVLPDGAVVYLYRIEDVLMVLAEENVLHLKNLGNGTTGFAKLDFMRLTTDELAKAQQTASKLFGSGGKPQGVLLVDSVLKKEQRDAIRASFAEMSAGTSTGRLFVLEANMKYQALGLTPEDQQLLQTRQFGVEEICRWFDVPPVLAHHSNVTTWGSGIEAILDGWYKLSVRPILVSIEQALTKRVLTPRQRARMSVEFNFDALLRGNAKDRAELYAQLVQNGIATRNECRQLENLPPMPGADDLTAQTNLLPLTRLGEAQSAAEEAAEEAQRAAFKAAEAENQRHFQLLAAVTERKEPVINVNPVVNVENKAPERQEPTNIVTNVALDSSAIESAAAAMKEATQAAMKQIREDIQNMPIVIPAPVVNLEAQINVEKQEMPSITVEAPVVNVSLPARRTETVIERDASGNIVRATQLEKDA